MIPTEKPSPSVSEFSSGVELSTAAEATPRDSLKSSSGRSFLPNKLPRLPVWLVGFLMTGIVGGLMYVAIERRGQSSEIQPDVQTVNVVKKDLAVSYPANGVVKAVRKINLSPRREGHVTELYIQEGDQVEQGQVIALMDTQELQAQVKQYRASLAQAQAELTEKKSGSLPQDIAEAEARVATVEADILQAQAKATQAEAELQRNQRLIEQGAISKNLFEESVAKATENQAALQSEQRRLKEQQANLDRLRQGTRLEEIERFAARVAEAQAQLEIYENQLGNAQIRAPFSGVISRLFVQVGDFVTPTTAASSSENATSASIAELSSGLEIEVKVPEANISQLSIGQLVQVSADAYAGEIFQGEVSLIAPRAIQENNVTFFVSKISLTTGHDRLKLGMNVKLEILGDQVRNALVVPLAAIVTQPDGETGVWVLNEDNHSQFQPVTVGATAEDEIQILSGVSGQDVVLISPPPTFGNADGMEQPIAF